MPASLPHTFVDGVGNVASGEDVMDNFNAVNAGVHLATVTSLPGSPVNGQDIYYLADATNGVVWHLKYRVASASTYKWEFVGGGSLQAEVLTLEARSVATYGDLTTVGPSLTCPLAGDYDFTLESAIEPGGVVNNSGKASLSFAGGAPSDNDAIIVTTPGTGSLDVSASRTVRRNVPAASTAVKMQYKSTSTNLMSFWNRHLMVVPLRVG